MDTMFAYVLVSLAEPVEEEVLDTFLEYDPIEDGHILFGEWDIILKVEGESNEAIAQFVIDKIRSDEAVHLTSTMIVAK